jgi:hypothetical protein
MFLTASLALSSLLSYIPQENVASSILSLIQDRTIRVKRNIYADPRAVDPRAELLASAIHTSCVQSVFIEYKDAYLAVLDHTALDFERIGSRDEFMVYVLEQEQSEDLLDRFVPGLSNTVQQTIHTLYIEGSWVEPAALSVVSSAALPEAAFDRSLALCLGEEIVNRVAPTVTEIHVSAYLTNTRSSRTYGGWERSPLGGIRPIVLDNPGAVYSHISEMRTENPDSVVESSVGETQAHIAFRGDLEGFISEQGVRF